MNQFYITTLRILKFDPSIVFILNSLNFFTKFYPTNCRRYEIITVLYVVYSFRFCRKAYIQHTNVPDDSRYAYWSRFIREIYDNLCYITCSRLLNSQLTESSP